MTPGPYPDDDARDRGHRVLRRALAGTGWDLEYLDRGAAARGHMLEFQLWRSDGRWLWGRVDALGRCLLERHQRRTWLGASLIGGAPQPPQSIQFEDLFLGRHRPADVRDLLRGAVNYVADNALGPVDFPGLCGAWLRATLMEIRIPTDRGPA